MNGTNGKQSDFPDVAEDIRQRLQARLMRAILTFRVE